MRPTPAFVPVLLACAVSAAGCSSSTGTTAVPAATAVATTTVAPVTTTAVPTTTAAPVTTTVTPSTTVAVQTPFGVPGTLLSTESVDIGDRGVAWRVTYRSTSVAGDPIEVTGIIAAPAGDAPGPRPVLSVAHGTTGMADECAPSLGFPDGFSMAIVTPFL